MLHAEKRFEKIRGTQQAYQNQIKFLQKELQEKVVPKPIVAEETCQTDIPLVIAGLLHLEVIEAKFSLEYDQFPK